MVIAKSFALAAYLHGRGYTADPVVGIDKGNNRPTFTFHEAPESEVVAFRKTIGLLNALEHVARIKAGA
jgi:hypothetical protein